MSEAIFVESWIQAEQLVYLKLIEATGTQDKKSAFLGYKPANMVNVWSLHTGPSGNNEQTTWVPAKGTIHVHARIEATFANRADAQRFIMRCVRVMPIKDGIVQAFRIRLGGFPEPVPGAMELGNENKSFLVYDVVIGCELVWNTGGVD
jgi:hypothetical protein